LLSSPVKLIVAGKPAHTAAACVAPESVGDELTVMKKLIGFPVHPLALGVRVTVANPVIGVKTGIEGTPVWLANPTPAPPVMSNMTPNGVPVIGMAEVTCPLQSVWLPGEVTVGI
jgi:hypothetical protein